jgi:hypothetical protein
MRLAGSSSGSPGPTQSVPVRNTRRIYIFFQFVKNTCSFRAAGQAYSVVSNALALLNIVKEPADAT